jgi:hypothetical protein
MRSRSQHDTESTFVPVKRAYSIALAASRKRLASSRALEIDPTFTQAKWREHSFYSDPAIVEREVADLASPIALQTALHHRADPP